MAAKLTFSAGIEGLDNVNTLLKEAESRLNSLGNAGGTSFDGIDKKMQSITKALESLTKSQSGLGGITNAFDELTRKSNEFLGKSYKGIIDAAKIEVKHFEQQSDEILRKLKDNEAELEKFRAKKASMSESDFQAGEALRQKELAATQASAVAIAQQKQQLEQQIRVASPINERLYSSMSSVGLGEYATRGALMQYGPRLLAGVGGAYVGAERAWGLYNEGSIRQDYTMGTDAYLAQRRLRLGAAQGAMQGDPTALLLQESGVGLEANITNDPAYSNMVSSKTRLQTAWARALQGAGAGAVAGTFMGGPVGTLLGGLIGGAGGFFAGRATEKTREQIEAETRGEYRSRDLELYGLAGREAGSNRMTRDADLEKIQRLLGVAATDTLSALISRQGVSMTRANPILNAMVAQGINPMGREAEIASFSFANAAYGFSAATQQAQLRNAALNRISLPAAQAGYNTLGAISGLTSVLDQPARSAMNDYIAARAGQRGLGESELTVGGAVAGAVSAVNPMLPGVEKTFQGITNFEALQQRMGIGGGGINTIMIQKLASMGITNAFAVETFSKMDLTASSTHEAISKYLGGKMSPKEVAAALGSSLDIAKTAFASSVGAPELERLNRATGKDVSTLYMTGSLKAFDNTKGGGGFFDVAKASFTPPEGSKPVEVAAVSGADITDRGRAGVEAGADTAMQNMLNKTGAQVSDAITRAVIKGYQNTIDEIQKLGAKGPVGTSNAPPQVVTGPQKNR